MPSTPDERPSGRPGTEGTLGAGVIAPAPGGAPQPMPVYPTAPAYPPYSPYPPYPPYPPYGTPANYAPPPVYPPAPETYRADGGATVAGAAMAPAAVTDTEQHCQWCGTANRLNARRCRTCGAPLPLSGHSAAFPPRGPGGAYPPFAPGGRVDPALMRQSEPAQRRSGATTTAVGLGATVIAILTKLGLIIKFALPLFSALASFGVYAALYGWQFGLGLVGLLFVHEMGHVVLIRAKGLPTSAPVFIPLLGAFVAMKRMPANARDQAEIAIAGPLAGTLGGFACYALYLQSGLHVWLALAFSSFLLNLLNLIPVGILDGGRVAAAISRWMWPVGLVLVGVAFYYTHGILLILVGLLGFSRMIAAFRVSPARAAYYRVPAGERLAITVLYFGLAAVLGLATYFTQSLLPPGGLFGQ